MSSEERPAVDPESDSDSDVGPALPPASSSPPRVAEGVGGEASGGDSDSDDVGPALPPGGDEGDARAAEPGDCAPVRTETPREGGDGREPEGSHRGVWAPGDGGGFGEAQMGAVGEDAVDGGRRDGDGFGVPEKMPGSVSVSDSLARKRRRVVAAPPAPPPCEPAILAQLPFARCYERSLMHRASVSALAVDAKAGFVITGSRDGDVRFWKKRDGGVEFAKRFQSHAGEVLALASSPDGAFVASAGADGTLKLFDAVAFDLIQGIRLPFVPSTLCWVYLRAGDGAPRLAVGRGGSGARAGAGEIWVVDPRNEDASDAVRPAALAEERLGETLGEYDDSDGDDEIVTVGGGNLPATRSARGNGGNAGGSGRGNGGNAGGGAPVGSSLRSSSSPPSSPPSSSPSLPSYVLFTVCVHSAPVTSIAYVPSRRAAVSVDVSGAVFLWDVSAGAAASRGNGVLWTMKLDTDLYDAQKRGVSLASVAASPEGGLFATLGVDQSLRVFDWRTGKRRGAFDESAEALVRKISKRRDKERRGREDGGDDEPAADVAVISKTWPDEVELGRRVAIERERIDQATHEIESAENNAQGDGKSKPANHKTSTTPKTPSSPSSSSPHVFSSAPLPLSLRQTILFDPSGRFLFVPTLLGVAVRDVRTGKVLAYLGGGDPGERLLQLALWEDEPGKAANRRPGATDPKTGAAAATTTAEAAATATTTAEAAATATTTAEAAATAGSILASAATTQPSDRSSDGALPGSGSVVPSESATVPGSSRSSPRLRPSVPALSSLSALTYGDPTLVASAFRSQRFYLYSRREPSEDSAFPRDVLNEMPVGPAGGGTHASGRPLSGLGGAPGAASATPASHLLPSSATLHTTKGDVTLTLFGQLCPRTVENFALLSRRGYYDGVLFHRVIKGFMAQTGDPEGDGTGGESAWGGTFADELRPDLRHDRPYTLSMANAGPNTNGSQFFITLAPTPWLDGKHTVFGRVANGSDVVAAIGNAKTNPRTDRPLDDIKIVSVELEGDDL